MEELTHPEGAFGLDGFIINEGIDVEYQSFEIRTGAYVAVSPDAKKFEFILGNAHVEESNHDDFFRILHSTHNLGVRVRAHKYFESLTNPEIEQRLIKRVQNYGNVIDFGANCVFDGEFSYPEFIELVYEDSQNAQVDFASLLDCWFVLLDSNAKRSLKNNKPNYQVNVSALKSSIEDYLGMKLKTPQAPKQIYGHMFKERNLTEVIEDYVYTIGQKSAATPFTFNEAMHTQARRLTKNLENDVEKALVIYQWVHNNISYGDKKRSPEIGRRDAMQTYKDREGVCCEQAYVQTVLERLVGNKARVAHVYEGTKAIDSKGNKLIIGGPHAVVAHQKPDGDILYIDTTTPNGFGIKLDYCDIERDEEIKL